ncbi:MAG: hypothetical protein IT379_41275 [Deltaproteobacteria bacterium]|nr:hypothetical protein [Deltaproteobacteria bacterium]
MTLSRDDRAYALRGLIAMMLTAERRVVDDESAPEEARACAEIRMDALVEVLVWTDRWIPEDRREPDVMDHPTKAEVEQVAFALGMVVAGLATVGETFDPEGALVSVLAQLGLGPALRAGAAPMAG